jgi:kynurenine formamidase
MRVFAEDPDLYNRGEPGIDPSTLPWLQRHNIVAVGSDNNAVEVIAQYPKPRMSIHESAIRDLGIYLMENFNLDALAADKVYECLLVVAPLQLTGGAGSPINPIAIA